MLQRTFLMVLTLLSALALQGQIVRVDCHPKDSVYIVANPEKIDDIYVFNNIKFANFTTIDERPAEWYEYPNTITPLATSVSFQDVQDGKTYVVKQDTITQYFAVFDFQNYRLQGHQLSASLSCNTSFLSLPIDSMAYVNKRATTSYLPLTLVAHYNNLYKDSLQWIEQTFHDTLSVSRPRAIDMRTLLLQSTDILLTEERFSVAFYEVPDTLSLSRDSIAPIAIDFIPLSYTSLRGDKHENEVDRVIIDSVTSGSAPLNILFKSNATPLTEFYLWEIKRSQETLSTRTEENTRYIFDQSGNYKVGLRVSNSHGCECNKEFTISAKESLLAAPNVFTPNGDGVNDEFRAVYRSIDTFRMLIFNRWQHQVFETNNPMKGWDGRINNRPAPEGAYIYIIEAVGTDGEKYKLKGIVNLIRGK